MIDQTVYIPKFPLSQFVDSVWIGKSRNLELEANHYAPLFTELIFNFGDQFQVSGQHIENHLSDDCHFIISGLKTTPFHTRVSGTYESIGLILKPFCYRLLLEKMETDIMKDISKTLHELLLHTKKPAFVKAEFHLIELFKNFSLDSDLIKFEHFIFSKILQTGFLKDFNASLSISQKGFIQKFKKYYFLTPNQYIRLNKVNRAIHLMKNTNTSKLTSIGLDSGFYDQAHFINVFKKFSGKTPGAFNAGLSKLG